jgi:hypothetical protein
MIRSYIPFLLAVSLLAGLSGCSVSGLSSAPKGSETKLSVTPEVQAGGYAAQAVVSPYTANDVNHLVLTLSTVNGPQVTPVASADVPKADLGQSLVFAKLKPSTTYRIAAKAYKAAGTAIGDLISVDASSSIDLSTGNHDSHAVTIPVQLVDRAFSGGVLTPGVSVTDGAFLPSGSVTVATQSVNP